MNGFFNCLRDGLQRLMTGRYGTDGLSRALLIASAVFLVLSLLTRGLFFLILAFACLAYIYFRMFSRNYEARRRENDKYLEVTSKVRKSFRVQKKRFDLPVPCFFNKKHSSMTIAGGTACSDM